MLCVWKAYNYPVREIWAVSFVKDDGRVGAIPAYRVYQLYDYRHRVSS